VAKLEAKLHKIAADGSVLTVYRDPSGGWYLGRPGNDLAYHPTPMGAFASAMAAQRWADRLFPGGAWERGAFRDRPEPLRARRGLQGAT
jgi:hypothetical protein